MWAVSMGREDVPTLLLTFSSSAHTNCQGPRGNNTNGMTWDTMNVTSRDQLTSFPAASFPLGDPRRLGMLICTCTPYRRVVMEQGGKSKLDYQWMPEKGLPFELEFCDHFGDVAKVTHRTGD